MNPPRTITRTINVALYLFPEVEVLDFAGPYEVFTTASRVARRRGAANAPFAVFTVSRQGQPVRARAGLSVAVDYRMDNHPPIDLLIVPGGVVDGERHDAVLNAWLRSTAKSAQICASVCTGAFLLADAGLLKGLEVTTHWEDQAQLQQEFPDLQVCSDRRWVSHPQIVTSGGISAGIDMSLSLVGHLVDEGLAHATARQMEYRWLPNAFSLDNQ